MSYIAMTMKHCRGMWVGNGPFGKPFLFILYWNNQKAYTNY